MKKTNINLIPNTQNLSPDYYCTWQTQLYATSDGKPEAQRAIIGERALFDTEKPFGWAYFYENARRDLFLVMDDSWDVPLSGDNSYYGCLILDKEKFPGFTLKTLAEKIKSLGWKGLGGWICAQESEIHSNNNSPEDYWKERLKEAEDSGISYWKVDWGKSSRDVEFRKMLTKSGKIYAPNLVIEHALVKSAIPYSNVYRTYDVPAIMSIPMTMEKLCDILNSHEGGLINCEDEAYIAAAGGFTMGIMRHPYSGVLPDGKADMSFPEIHRNLKSKMFEVIRAARWHRIAPAFEITGSHTNVSDLQLTDTWEVINKDEEIEQWWFDHALIKDSLNGEVLTKSAPAIISRNTQLPQATPNENGFVPYIVSSKNPNGTFSIATCGRTTGREYIIPKCDITVNIEKTDTIGIFGEYNNLILKNTDDFSQIFMQDLAGEYSYDITDEVCVKPDKIIIPGSLIHKIGTMEQPVNDTSEPGVVLKMMNITTK